MAETRGTGNDKQRNGRNTHPLHLGHSTFLESDNFFVVPLYTSSRVTLRGWTTFSPRRWRLLPLPEPAGKGTDGIEFRRVKDRLQRKTLFAHEG